MPRTRTPLEEYLALGQEDLNVSLADLSSELSLLDDEQGVRTKQLEVDLASPDFFSPGDIPSGLSLREALRFAGNAREGSRRQAVADLAMEFGDRKAEILDDRNSQLRNFLNTQKRLSLINQKGVLDLWDKDVVPKNQGLRMEIVPSMDREGNPVYQQVYKKVDEEAVRIQEIADWLGVPPEVAERQVTHELILDQQEQRKAQKEQMTLVNAAKKEKREQRTFERQEEADKRRKLNDIISQMKEIKAEPGLLGHVFDPNSLPAQLAAKAIGRDRVIGDNVALQKEAADIENKIEADIAKAIDHQELVLPANKDDIEGKQRFLGFVEQRRNFHTANTKLIRGAIQKIPGYEDFGIGSLEKRLLDDAMQESIRKRNSPYGQLDKRTSDLERIFGIR
jgi:hypothetical protein